MKEITEKNMLDWLEGVRLSAAARLAALGDGDEERVQDGPEAREVCIINAIAERVKEITAVEFLSAVNEECAKHDRRCESGHSPCEACAFYETCIYGECENTRLAVETVKRWMEEQDG